ncbi:MAG: AmmeMemoRadiSam system protein B [Deltaproteobacteria bacterium]|nr:AmmeMemoRadiSam system protein B [Deltaproteobacteria bacterium]
MKLPGIRCDLEFFPIQHEGQQFVLIRDGLGLVEEGKAVGLPLFQIMGLLDGDTTLRDLQTALMRQKGGTLVSTDEIQRLVAHLDESFLLDSERYREARNRMIADFASRRLRPCSHCGKSYPRTPSELKARLDKILNSHPVPAPSETKITALMAPHIDLSVGFRSYAAAYQTLKGTACARIILLGVGHQLQGSLFCLTDKDFETPLGLLQADQEAVGRLREAGRDIIAANDFVHRTEHSIEFQAIFLQHVLPDLSPAIVPILCGSLQAGLPDYTRQAYQETAGGFLENLKSLVREPEQDTLIIAGVDFCHIGPKFGHTMPAPAMEAQARTHDRNLLRHLVNQDADGFWKESRSVGDRFNVCGFSALACLLEILPDCRGEVLHHEIWHEPPTRSAVSFAAAVFRQKPESPDRETCPARSLQ